jgi:hypothetical protein
MEKLAQNFFEEMPEVNNCPKGKNSPNLVTLIIMYQEG